MKPVEFFSKIFAFHVPFHFSFSAKLKSKNNGICMNLVIDSSLVLLGQCERCKRAFRRMSDRDRRYSVNYKDRRHV